MQRHVGRLSGFGVLVADEHSIIALHEKGFGKGILSRSAPCFFTRSVTEGQPRTGKREAFHAKQGTTLLGRGHEKEFLQLSLVEAFYLQDVGNCLSVYLYSAAAFPPESVQIQDSPLSTEVLWSKLVEEGGKNFVIQYCVYCHYRSMGWVVRGGLKFGVDFLLYSLGGPSRKHGELAVFIQELVSQESVDNGILGVQNMLEFQALSRVTETVAKGLLLCLVRSTSNSVPWTNPQSMQYIEIEDHVVSRWDPTKTR